MSDDLTTAPEEETLLSGLKLWAKVGLQLGTSIDKLAAAQSEWAKLQYNTPVDYQTYASGTYTSAGLWLSLGQPDNGTYWEVHNVIIGGTDFNVTAAGQAGLYVSGAPGLASGLNMARDYATYLPNVATYGTRVLVVNDQETLWIKLFNGTSGQQYVANASVTVYKSRTDANVVTAS
jgi:hypothetical protein